MVEYEIVDKNGKNERDRKLCGQSGAEGAERLGRKAADMEGAGRLGKKAADAEGAERLEGAPASAHALPARVQWNLCTL